MKGSIFLFVFLFCITACFAQDTIERKNRLSNSVIERFEVLKTSPEIRIGKYKAFYRRRTLIAAGNYKAGIKSGVWNFFDDDGKLNERYNYDTGEFAYEAPLDTDTNIGFGFDAEVIKTDRLTRPLKIGGTYYGFIPYLNVFKLPFDATELNTDYINAEIELLISPGGRLADYKVHLNSRAYDYHQTFNLDINLFNEEDKKFIPATLNQQPILARIFIKCAVNNDGSIDFY